MRLPVHLTAASTSCFRTTGSAPDGLRPLLRDSRSLPNGARTSCLRRGYSAGSKNARISWRLSLLQATRGERTVDFQMACMPSSRAGCISASKSSRTNATELGSTSRCRRHCRRCPSTGARPSSCTARRRRYGCTGWSLWWITPPGLRCCNAMFSAASTNSAVICSPMAQPTMRRLHTSSTMARKMKPARVGT